MKIESLHVGMRVKHSQYGLGTVKTISEHTSDIRFDEGLKTVAPETSGLQPAEPQIAISGLEQPLALFMAETARAIVQELGLEQPDAVVEELGTRWHKGRVMLHPADAGLQPKEVPLEVFFHKVVMV